MPSRSRSTQVLDTTPRDDAKLLAALSATLPADKVLWQGRIVASITGFVASVREAQATGGKELVRPHILDAMLEFARRIALGQYAGLFAHGAGGGKTLLFALTVGAIGLPGLVNVPFGSLRDNTIGQLELAVKLLNKLIPDKAKRFSLYVVTGTTNNTTAKQIQKILTKHRPGVNGIPIVVLTYQGVVALHRSDPDLFVKFMDYIAVIARDEVHLSLGPKTTEAFKKGLTVSIDETISGCLGLFEDKPDRVKKLFAPLLEAGTGGPSERVLAATITLVAEVDGLRRTGGTMRGAHKEQRAAVVAALMPLIQAAQKELESDEGNGDNGNRDEVADEHTASVDALFDHMGSIFGRLSEAAAGACMPPHDKPVLQMFLTGTVGVPVEEIEEKYGVPLVHRVSMFELANEGHVLLPTERVVGEAVSTTSGVIVGGKIPYRLADGRDVITATIEEWMIARAAVDNYLPTLFACPNIAIAEAVTIQLRKRGIKAVRCTTGNGTFPAGMSPAETQAGLEKAPADATRIEAAAIVNQGATGWNVPCVRCVAFVSPRGGRNLLQTVARANRPLPEGSPWPNKTSENTLILTPHFSIRTPATKEKPEHIWRSPSFYEVLVRLGEVPLSFALKRNVVFRTKFVVDWANPEHRTTFFGSPQALSVRGLPVDMMSATFPGNHFMEGRNARSIRDHLSPGLFGIEAARRVHDTVWPNERPGFFDISREDDLAFVLASPDVAMAKGKVCLSQARDWVIKDPARGWDLTREETTEALFGQSEPTEGHLRGLLSRRWPPTMKGFDSLDFKDKTLEMVRKVVPHREACLAPDFLTRVHANGNHSYTIRGWYLVERLTTELGWVLDANNTMQSFAEHLYPQNTGHAATGSSSARITTIRILKQRAGDMDPARIATAKALADLRLLPEPVYERNPEGTVAQGGFHPYGATAFGYRVIVYVKTTDSNLGYRWAAHELIKACFEDRKVHQIKQIQVPAGFSAGELVVPTTVSFDSALNAATACSSIIAKCYAANWPVPVLLPVVNVWMAGNKIIRHGQFLGGKQQFHIDSPSDWGAMDAISKRFKFKPGSMAPALSALDPITVAAGCPAGLVARKDSPESVKLLVQRCSLDPANPITLLDGRMLYINGGWQGSYKLREKTATGKGTTERAAWAAAASKMLATLGKWSPPKKIDVPNADLEFATATDVVMSQLGVAVKKSMSEVDPQLGVRHSVQAALPIGRLELSAYSKTQNPSLIGQLSRNLGLMLLEHGFRPFIVDDY